MQPSDFTQFDEEITKDEDSWEAHALPLDPIGKNLVTLLDRLKPVAKELAEDARRALDENFAKYDKYTRLLNYPDGRITSGTVEVQLATLRARFMESLDNIGSMLGVGPTEQRSIEAILIKLGEQVHSFTGSSAVEAAILAVINAARKAKYGGKSKPLATLREIAPLNAAFQLYTKTAFEWHLHQADLRQKYATSIMVQDNYTIWTGQFSKNSVADISILRDRFAFETALVTLIRLVLIRILEDKGIFPHPILSSVGLAHWQDETSRYFPFPTHNPYAPLTSMAFCNAGSIYPRFLSSSELFNWYTPDPNLLIKLLTELSRFNFAGVDGAILSVVCNACAEDRQLGETEVSTELETLKRIPDEAGFIWTGENSSANSILVDTKCGSGTFLVAAARQFIQGYTGESGVVENPATVLEKVQSRLFGFDISPFACYLTEMSFMVEVLDLVKLAHRQGEKLATMRFHIYNADFIAWHNGFNTLSSLEAQEVDQLKTAKLTYHDGFALVQSL